jgi:hypothetical protein
MAIKHDIDRDFESRKFPGVKREPVIGNLYLIPVDNLLFKDAISSNSVMLAEEYINQTNFGLEDQGIDYR